MKLWRLIPAFLLILLPLMAGNLAAASASDDPVKTEKALKEVKKQIAELQKAIKSTQTQRSSAEVALQKTEQEIGATQRKLRDVQARQQDVQQQMATLKAKQSELEDAKERQRKAMRADVVAAWRNGRQEYLKLMLNQEDPAQVSRLVKYYEYFGNARLARVENFNQTLTELADTETQIQARDTELQTLEDELTAEQARLQKAKDQRKTLLTQLNSSLKTDTAKANQLKADQGALEKVLKTLQARFADLPTNLGKVPFATLQGKLKWPTQGKLLHSFGSGREQGTLRWNGVLIGAPSGSAVRAVHHGRVVFADWMRGFGNLIIVDHGGGYMSLYGHNDSLLKSPGDWVQGGDAIAVSGNSGGQPQSGLYFEIRHKGSPVNPARWCRN